MKDLQGYTLLKAIGAATDEAVADAILPDDAIITAPRPKRRRAVAAFFEKPAVVAAVCAIVALGTVVGIFMAGQAVGDPVPPLGGSIGNSTAPSATEENATTPQEPETDLLPEEILRHNDLYYVSHGDGTCSLVGIAALPEDMVLTIPETAVNGDRVVSLRNMTMTSSLAVPNGVHLFQVKGIHIPATVTDIHIDTLHEMTALESLTVDEENPVYRSEENCLIEKERERLVYAHPHFEVDFDRIMQSSSYIPFPEFVIPDSVKVIATNALHHEFYKISGEVLEEYYKFLEGAEGTNRIPYGLPVDIHIPASVEQIEERFFVNDSYMAISLFVDEDNPIYYAEGNCLIRKDSNTVILGSKNAKIPDGVTAIAPYAFEGAGLTSIHIPASVESIGELAFWNNPDLTTITGDVSAMPKIEINPDADGTFSCYYVLEGCLIQGEIQVKDGAVTTTHTLILGCANSAIPSHITDIGDYAFAWNRGLTEIDLPADLQSIGFKAFTLCPNLMTIRYNNTYERWCQVAVDDTWICDNGQLAKLYFTDQEIPMTVIGVTPDYSGKGKTEN
ncbi:MAG: leucine-rich repeat protein [Clostridia bacterium]|nr:leucine-rich repeat protein [Clostridia bacterium]